MKKTVLLVLSAMAIVFCGCTGAGYGLLRSGGNGHALINTHTRPLEKSQDARGVCLSISAKSSLNIDVACILAYVQGDATADTEEARSDLLNPWIRLNYSF